MKKNKRLKILFLPAWYPSEENPVNGIFIKEYAKAVSLYNEVVVLYSYSSLCTYIRKPYRFFRIYETIEDGIRTIRIKLCGILNFTKDRFLKTFPRLSKNKSNIGRKICASNFIPKILKNFLRIPYIIVRDLLHYLCIFVSFSKLVKGGWRPDIIHAYVFSAGVPAIFLGKLYKIPVVITELNTNVATYSLTTFNRMKLCFALSRANVVLPISKDLEESIKNYCESVNRFFVVPCVVNTNVFYPTNKQIKNKVYGKKRMLTVCILTARKGINYLLEALHQLKYKRKDFILDIVGDGPNRVEYEDLAKSLGLEELVKFHGKQPQIISFMRECDFFVLPSLYENFGVVYIEAMACGKPVIATNAGGAKEFINKEVGILVQPKDSGALAKSIDYMLDNYKDYSSKKIFKYTKDNFSYEVVGEKLDKIYRDI